MVEPADIERLEKAIAHTVAPAFMLAGIAGLIAVMSGRLNSIIERSRTLNAIVDEDAKRGHLRADIPRLVRRAELVNRARCRPAVRAGRGAAGRGTALLRARGADGAQPARSLSLTASTRP